MPGFFSQNFFVGVDLLSGTIFSPRRGRSQMGGLTPGPSQIRGIWKKLSAEAKNAPPHSKIRENWHFKHRIELSNAVLN